MVNLYVKLIRMGRKTIDDVLIAAGSGNTDGDSLGVGIKINADTGGAATAITESCGSFFKAIHLARCEPGVGVAGLFFCTLDAAKGKLSDLIFSKSHNYSSMSILAMTAAQRLHRPFSSASVECIQQRGHLVPGAS